MRGVREDEKRAAQIFEPVLFGSWDAPAAFQPEQDKCGGQRDDGTKRDNFDHRIVAANPLDSDVLEGKDQHCHDEKADSLNIVTSDFHSIPC